MVKKYESKSLNVFGQLKPEHAAGDHSAFADISRYNAGCHNTGIYIFRERITR